MLKIAQRKCVCLKKSIGLGQKVEWFVAREANKQIITVIVGKSIILALLINDLQKVRGHTKKHQVIDQFKKTYSSP